MIVALIWLTIHPLLPLYAGWAFSGSTIIFTNLHNIGHAVTALAGLRGITARARLRGSLWLPIMISDL